MAESTYLGVCARIDPPLIGVYYKSKDDKKKVYTILLNKLVFNPDAEEVAEQLFRQHPHILIESKISKEKIAEFVRKIQAGLDIDGEQEDEYGEQEFEEEGKQQNEEHEEHEDFDFNEPNAQLNRST